MIIIGYNHQGYIISIVNTKSVELAYAYWQGSNAKINSHKIVEEDFLLSGDHPTGVVPILKTQEVKGSNIIREAEVIIVRK